MQIGHVYFCQQSTSPNVCARKRFIPQEAINISIPGADENWVCYRPGEMTRLAECNCRLLVPLTPARLIVLHDERSNIFYYVQLGTCNFMVILGSLMLLQMQRFSPLPHYVDSSVLPSGLFLFLPWKQKQMGKKINKAPFSCEVLLCFISTEVCLCGCLHLKYAHVALCLSEASTRARRQS